jgi:hypothetical protein
VTSPRLEDRRSVACVAPHDEELGSRRRATAPQGAVKGDLLAVLASRMRAEPPSNTIVSVPSSLIPSASVSSLSSPPELVMARIAGQAVVVRAAPQMVVARIA